MDHFRELQPGEIVSLHFEEVIQPERVSPSQFRYRGLSYSEPGNYSLSVTYSQEFPGIKGQVRDLILLEILDRRQIEDREDLKKDSGHVTLFIDLNAWVGEITSNRVTITMPEFPPNQADSTE